MVMQQQRLQGVTVGSVEDLQAMADAIAANRLTPVMDKTFPLAEAKAAFDDLLTYCVTCDPRRLTINSLNVGRSRPDRRCLTKSARRRRYRAGRLHQM